MCRRVAAAGLVAAVLGVVGCSQKPVPVAGVVTLDGEPVDGANVTFMTEDGSKTYSGNTDAGGNFKLAANGVEGAMPGNYKVLVVKTKTVSESMDPTSPEYMKMMAEQMKGDAKDAKKGSATKTPGGTPPPGMKMMAPPGGMMAPPGGMMGGGSGPGLRSELPEMYGLGAKTPLTATVGPAGEPKVELKLVSDKKDKKDKK